MNRMSPGLFLAIAAAFLVGFFSHTLYRRWTGPAPESQGYPVTYSPLPAPPVVPAEIPLIQARDVERIRTLAGSRARIQGRVYRVGFSDKSNTYFLNFGPSRSAFTAVIFASALEGFDKKKIRPKSYEGKEIEITGIIKDHPKYGLEMVLEDPGQIRALD